MKAKELKEMRGKSKIELLKLARDKKIEVVALIGKMYAGREKNLKKARSVRRDIAQIMTIIGEGKNK